MPEDTHDLRYVANPSESSLQWHAPVLHCFDTEDAESGGSVANDGTALS